MTTVDNPRRQGEGQYESLLPHRGCQGERVFTACKPHIATDPKAFCQAPRFPKVQGALSAGFPFFAEPIPHSNSLALRIS